MREALKLIEKSRQMPRGIFSVPASHRRKLRSFTRSSRARGACHFLGSQLDKEYVPLLKPEARDALNRLKKRFSTPDKYVKIRDNFAFHHPSLDDMEDAFQLAIKSDGDETDWCMYLNNALLNSFFFASDFVLVHGVANAMGEPDVNEAHRKMLGDIAHVANDLSSFAFGFAEVIFIKHFGELTATQVADIKDAANIEDLRLPWFLSTDNILPS
jgi:hypothetical protein